MFKTTTLIIILGFSVAILSAQNIDPPIIPIGEDAYLQWDRLPYQRIGLRAYMRSTYDREGNNRRADASHYLYQETDTFNVTLDVQGPGILYFKRTNFFHGSPWHYEVDGTDFIVKETATDDPIDVKNKYPSTKFLPENLFPHPLTWTWSITKGADLMWVPIPFSQTLRLAYSRTFYGTGYYIYHQFPLNFTHTSQPLVSWQQKPPAPQVLELIRRSGTDISPSGEEVNETKHTVTLNPHERQVIATLSTGPRTLRALEFRIPRNQAAAFGKCRLTITWDQRWHPSIDAPIDLFFGAGHLYNPENKPYLVQGFPLYIKYEADEVILGCYWPMPYMDQAQIELAERSGQRIGPISVRIKDVPFSDAPREVGYFHATYKDLPHLKPGEDVQFLDTDQVEGGGPWSGNFVGMSWIFTRRGNLTTLEGDPRFFFDDSKTPQAWGTGTEEWGGGGNYWGGENMTIPFAGHPVGKRDRDAQSDKDLLNSAYRFLIADYFPFGKRAVIGLEHGGQNTADEHYSGVTYWYGAPAATLKLTDELNVCNAADIAAHNYQSSTAEAPYELVSRYEWGPDRDFPDRYSPYDQSQARQARMFFPAESDSVRIMKGKSTFTVRLDSINMGVLLRRKFDYQYPNQKASVWVRPANTDSAWNYAGIWYTAGSNTCYFSYPKGRSYTAAELSPTAPQIITSNRRWREEEFLIDHTLTEGFSQIEIQIRWIPDEKELLPGRPFPVASAWSEARYWVYCYQLEDWWK